VYGINDVITNSTINEIAQRIHQKPRLGYCVVLLSVG
jgi:hypothetical protein